MEILKKMKMDLLKLKLKNKEKEIKLIDNYIKKINKEIRDLKR